jgi:CDP-paratose 2-epimerase
MRILVAGSSGLIGSDTVRYLGRRDHQIVGIDNNMRREFFGPAGDTAWNTNELLRTIKQYRHLSLDIGDRAAILALCESEGFDAVIHCGAQPSYDRAREIPLVDFDVNAVGTLNLLEANRQHSPEAPFVAHRAGDSLGVR